MNDDVLTWTTYSGKTADPRWDSSSSSMVKPLQLTWRHKEKTQERKGGTEKQRREDTNEEVGQRQRTAG